MKHGTKMLKRVLSMTLALLMVLSMVPQLTLGASAVDMTGGEKLYLTPNSNWKKDGARFACYFFGTGDAWESMTKVEGETDLYEVTVPSGSWTNVIFCRMNPSAAANNWSNKWNQTGDLTYDGTNNHYTVKTNTWDNGGGTWSIYTPPAPECTHEDTTLEYPEGFDCEVGGDVTVRCSDCKEETGTQTVPAGEHQYVDDVCSICGSKKAAAEEPVAVDYYLIGYINGANYGCEEDYQNMGEYQFVNGKLTAKFDSDSYVFLKTSDNLNWYMAETYIVTDSGTFKNTSTGVCEKMFVPGGKELLFTLVVNADDTLTLSYEVLELCRVTFDVGADDVANAPASQDLYTGETVNKLDVDPTREGYTFGGWYTDAAYENAYDFSTPVTGSFTLYAKWTKNETTDPSTPSEPEEPETITIYFRNDWNWTNVSVHYWGGESGQGTTWPGMAMTKCDNDGSYDIYKAEVPAGVTGLVFTGNKDTDPNALDQSPDITEFADGDAFYMHWDGENKCSKFDYTPGSGEDTDPSEPSEPVEATYIVAGTEALCGTAWDVANTANKLTLGEDGLYTITYTSVPEEKHSFKVTDGSWNNSWGGEGADGNYEINLDAISNVTITFNAATKTITVTVEPTGEITEMVTYEVTLHFADTLGWGSVNLYTWTASGVNPTGGWPGSATTLDAKGFYSMSFSYEAPAGQGLNYIFGGGGKQTVDLTIPAADFVDNKVEKWVMLTTTNAEGKYNADAFDTGDAIAISPIVKDTSVTFQYKNAAASSVEVFGSWNNWKSGTALTENEHGVWSVTISNMPAGIQQYKFVVDGNWITDPANSWLENENSAFLISDIEKDKNTVNIVVNYTRADGDYENWNISAWDAPDLEEQYDFVVTDGVATTIIKLDGRASQTVGFKIRKSVGSNEWAEQSGEFRVNLSNVVSGTIYVNVADDFSATQTRGDDVVYDNKITDIQLDYEKNQLVIKTYQAVTDASTAFTLVQVTETGNIAIEGTSVTASGSTYTMKMPDGLMLDLVTLYQYKITFSEQKNEAYKTLLYDIGIDTVYATKKFAEEYTYTKIDKELGATWTSSATTFKVWAPTAETVSVNLYTSGTAGTEDLIKAVAMERGEKGVWSVTVEGNLNGTYYTYTVTVNGEEIEAVDPYARTAGVNGNRGMVIDLDSTDPDGWDSDTNPNAVDSQTDAIIYELHVRDFSIDDSSGMSNKGKYLAFTEEGTTVPGTDIATGIDYLDELGITHLHLLPVYDYGSVDETKCNNFNWGYDPVNYNVPEGSYSTNPYDGAARVKEFKRMVKSLHDHDISVVMDVVYNHVYDAEKFCFNNIVPEYFSRPNSNTSGCGNDTASEREMVRKYIVESVLYWHQEYHIDGFRFDLVGLLDVDTINQIVKEVHDCCPDVIFYGEGWNMDSTSREPGTEMAKQGNASKTPGFAYFSDSIRNGIAGSNGSSTGFASGAGNGASMASEWMAKPWWTTNPQQVIQYASCHDNYTLIDKLILSTGAKGVEDSIIKMNNLSAAFYMTAQGVPFIHAAEEILREKLEEGGGRCENSYNASDFVNHIEWSDLADETYAANLEYYKGLIAFRKAHAALRYATAAEVAANVKNRGSYGNLISMQIDGYGAGDNDIYVIFNAGNSAATVALPEGEWTININGTKAGTASLGTASGSVSVDAISAMVLTKADEGKDVEVVQDVTLYFSNNKYWDKVYAYAWVGSENVLDAWPGTEMTYVETNGYGEKIYSITVSNAAEGIIFSNGRDAQTTDQTVGSNGTGYYCDKQEDDGKWTCGTYVYGPVEVEPGFEDKSGIQDGVTLHCWNWSFEEIEKNMATIAAQGYTAIQTSPIQPLKEATNLDENSVGTHWWVYYQPVDFVITTDSGNALGTKADFKSMCRVAEQYGIKVIVDVVANHLGNKKGNDLADKIPEYLRKDEYWHDITTDIDNWGNRYNMTQYCLDGLPDLNTANKDIQGYVLDFLKECVDAGADGFRFDMAKSIETPSDTATFASDFWPTVIGGIQNYAGGDLYVYGEVLDNPAIAISAYTAYMSVTDNTWGNSLRSTVAGGNAGLSSSYHKAANASNLVVWAESHDTFANNGSSDVSETNINKTWALIAARKDAMGLYLARPEALTQALGVASATGWDNPEVEAANEFHNAFAGQSETIGNSGNFSYVVRGTEGIVIVNVGGTTADVELNVAMTDGAYTDQISGKTFTVADGKISGKIGDTGIAVVYSAAEESVSVAKIGDEEYESLTAALYAAEAGEKIELLANIKEENVTLTKPVTLNLNGYTLEAETFITLKGAQVENTKTLGYLKVPENGISLQSDNVYVPIWNESDGYYLVEWGYAVATKVSEDKATTTYYFLPKPKNAGTPNDIVVELLQNGAAENHLQITVQLAWNKVDGQMTQSFYYNENMVGTVYTENSGLSNTGVVFILKVTGYENFDNVTMRAATIYGDWDEGQFLDLIKDEAKVIQVK